MTIEDSGRDTVINDFYSNNRKKKNESSFVYTVLPRAQVLCETVEILTTITSH